MIPIISRASSKREGRSSRVCLGGRRRAFGRYLRGILDEACGERAGRASTRALSCGGRNTGKWCRGWSRVVADAWRRAGQPTSGAARGAEQLARPTLHQQSVGRGECGGDWTVADSARCSDRLTGLTMIECAVLDAPDLGDGSSHCAARSNPARSCRFRAGAG